jgi:hypothetical protein
MGVTQFERIPFSYPLPWWEGSKGRGMFRERGVKIDLLLP